MAMIELHTVTKRFRAGKQDMIAVENASMTVEPGEFICLLGPSGCGKTTLLNMVGGFVFPDVGEVLVKSERVRGPGADRGYLFQSPALFPWLTIQDNVLFGPKARHAYNDAARSRAAEILAIVGLSGFAKHYPQQLSGGMRHRAALARVLVNNPDVLLMDEPFAALDAQTRSAMQSFLLELWQQEGTTVLFVTHDIDESVLLADRIYVMSSRPGRIADEVPVTLKRPRHYSVTETPEFVNLRRTIRLMIEHDESAPSASRAAEEITQARERVGSGEKS